MKTITKCVEQFNWASDWGSDESIIAFSSARSLPVRL